MKIIYLHQYFATPESNTGTRSYEMAKRFVINGHDVIFVTSSAAFSDNYTFKKGWNYIEIEGIKLHVLHLDYSNKDSFIIRIWKFIYFSFRSIFKSLSVESDVVLATSTPLTIAIPGLIYSKIKSKPLVFEVRDLWPELPIATGAIKNKYIIKFALWLEEYTYRNSKRIIGLSPGMCEGVISKGISVNKVTLATNSCDTDLFDVDKKIGANYLKSDLAFTNGRKLIVYTGTFGMINKVGYIVELAKASQELDPNLCFVAIGDGMEKEEVIAEANKAGVLNKNLYILSPVPKTEIVKLLSAADLSLSLFGPVIEMWHNSANKLFDALAAQTPIAINYGGWQKSLIEKYHCGLAIDSTDYQNAAISISRFLNDKAQYSKAVESCKTLSYEHFSRDIMAARIEKTLMDSIND
ncbi:glycosyltransferase family 4 protein [Pseudoalteromonas sp. SWN166]|uniref:glycosyltransferase family 4 protein n=1 Tax=Pseudoalteromonas sp. SWN166 TaxID=2792061 RepID=UPI0018CF2042|nr:glycosyltransferase family 4 protein [Pseudoalteromonas sp. SWN166]MBH0038960.1 glycosyltransferase family 4 protein [Pseudoalteromonas sp. SWN166]